MEYWSNELLWLRALAQVGGVAERLIAPVLKTGRPKGLVSSNLTPSASLVASANEGDCITLLHNKSAYFSGVRCCVAKSALALRIALPPLISTSAYAPVEAEKRKSLLFLGGKRWCPPHPLPPMAAAGTQRLPPYLPDRFFR